VSQCLVLNLDSSPLDIQDLPKAFNKVLKKKAVVLEEYTDQNLQSWQDAMYAPAVIRMCYFVKTTIKDPRIVPFSRKNVWLRDKGICQYCGEFISLNDLHWDHVLPKVRGGISWWDNLVTCCLRCNNKKGDRTPEEANMKPLHRPVVPRQRVSGRVAMMMKLKAFKNFPHPKWRDWIYWNVELDKQ
jgi:5-methylcytosine-specific restriction endonuclease McrA